MLLRGLSTWSLNSLLRCCSELTGRLQAIKWWHETQHCNIWATLWGLLFQRSERVLQSAAHVLFGDVIFVKLGLQWLLFHVWKNLYGTGNERGNIQSEKLRCSTCAHTISNYLWFIKNEIKILFFSLKVCLLPPPPTKLLGHKYLSVLHL